MAIEKDIKVTIEEISKGASVEGFGNLLYLTSKVSTGASAGVIKEYSDLESASADNKTADDIKTISSIYFGAWSKSPTKLLIGRYDTKAGTKASDVFLKAIEEKKEFFVVVTDETIASDDITSLVNIMDANKKLYFLQKGDTKGSGNTFKHNLESYINQNVKNLALFYGHSVHLAVACASYLASVDLEEAGSSFSLKFKQPSIVKASDITSSQEEILRRDNVNYLIQEFKNTKAIIKNGVMSDSTPIDKVQAINFMRSKMEISIFNYLIQNKKLSMSQRGYSLLERKIESVLEGFVSSGMLSQGQVPINGEDVLVDNYKVIMPDANELSPTQRQLGVVKGIQIFLAYDYSVSELSLNITV